MGAVSRVFALICLLAVPGGCAVCGEGSLEAARRLQGEQQFEASIGPLRAVLADSPGDPEANYLLGLALARTGRLGPAAWPLRTASESEPYAEVAGQLLCLTLLQTANYDEAESAANRLLERDASSTAALRLRLQSYLGNRRFEKAYAEAQAILTAEPDDRQTALLAGTALVELERWDEAEAAFEALRTRAQDADDEQLAGRACLGLATVAEARDDFEGVANRIEGCLADHPTDPIVLAWSAGFYERRQEPDQAERIWRNAVARAPDSLPFRLRLGNQLVAVRDYDEAERVLAAAVADFAHPLAWEALAEMYRRKGDSERAQAVLEKAHASGADSERLRFKRADLLVDAGELDAAEALARDFEESSFRDFVRGRVLLERGDARGALASFEAGLVRWPDNAEARAAAGRAAQELGDFEKAFEHYRQAIRANVRATEAAYAAAHLARALGRLAEASEYARYYVLARVDVDPEALEFAVRASLEAGHAAYAAQYRQSLERMAIDSDPRAVAALARLHRSMTGPPAALATIEGARLDLTDPTNEPVLRAKVDLLVAEGHADDACTAVERALEKHPDSVPLLDLYGRVLELRGRRAEARRSFARALAQDPDHAPALAASGALSVLEGDLSGALTFFDRAVAADPNEVDSAHRAAQIVLGHGDRRDAERRLRAVLLRAPGHAGAANDLAWLLAEQGRELDLALALAERAVRLAPEPNPSFTDTLAAVQLARNDARAAVRTLTAAIARHPDSALLHYRLGLAQEETGDAEAALAAYRKVLEDDSFSEAGGARARIARLESAAAR